MGLRVRCGARWPSCAGLPSSVRSRSGQPCSLCRVVDLCVLRPARPRFRFGLTRAPHESPTSGGYRRIHIRLRGRVLCNPPHLKGFRTARPYETAVLFQNLVSVGFPLGLRPRPSKRYAFFGGYAAQNKAAQCILGNWANGACVRLSLRGKARLLTHAPLARPSAMARFSS